MAEIKNRVRKQSESDPKVAGLLTRISNFYFLCGWFLCLFRNHHQISRFFFFVRPDYTHVPVTMIRGNLMTTPSCQRQLSAVVSHNLLGIRYFSCGYFMNIRFEFPSVHYTGHLWLSQITIFYYFVSVGLQAKCSQRNIDRSRKCRNEYKITYLHGNEF